MKKQRNNNETDSDFKRYLIQLAKITLAKQTRKKRIELKGINTKFV